MIFKQILQGALQLFFPHICQGCGSDLLRPENLLCIRCLSELPHTRFAFFENNPVEKIFIGRLPIAAAHSEFYFTKNELIQTLIHKLKYNGRKDIGICLGEMLGTTLMQSGRFNNLDYLIPLPLFAQKEYERGYNQAEIICRGIQNISNSPILTQNLIRQRPTETQTRKHRTERWQNVDGSFVLRDPSALENKSILLVDDVLTTGATMEACGRTLQEAEGLQLHIAVIAYASK